MNHKSRALLVIGVLILSLLACNLPLTSQGTDQEPAPNLTLTALFEVTPETLATETPTLPPVLTATPAGGSATATQDANTGGGVAVTETQAPTATKAPGTAPTATKAAGQATQSPVTRASNGKVEAKFLSTAPTIDGDWSEWKDLTTEYPANNVVWGKKNWANADDLSASFHAGWDNTYLYLAVKVKDNKYVQNASGENLFKGDSLEILWDRSLQADVYNDVLSPDDFQLGIGPGRPDANGTKEAYLWLPSNIAGNRTNVKIATKAETGGYRVEVAIPWTVFETTPKAGEHYGFALSVSDNDDPNNNAQQKMVSNDPNRSLVDPTTWGDLLLVK